MPYDVLCANEAESSGNVTAIIRPGRLCKRGRQASEHGLQEGVWRIILHGPDRCTRLSAVAATGGSLAALCDNIISQLTLALKVNAIDITIMTS